MILTTAYHEEAIYAFVFHNCCIAYIDFAVLFCRKGSPPGNLFCFLNIILNLK